MIARLRGVRYHYPRAASPALDCVDLDLDEGSFTLLTGPSGGGKSTLLRVFNGLVPQFHGGRFAGRVTVAGLDPTRTPPRRMATAAGMVFQEPEAQAVADTVLGEVAFGMEQAGVAHAEMGLRAGSLLESLGLGHLRHRKLATLSGGERQRTALAAVLAMEPRLLLLDEPTSQLDGEGAAALLDAVERLRQQRGLTVAVAEHRLDRLLPVASGVVVVCGGRVATLTPREAAAHLPGAPGAARLFARLGIGPVPLTTSEAAATLAREGVALRRREAPAPTPGDELVGVEGIEVAYGGEPALRGVSLSLRQGEVLALVGPNGSGKTTLLRAIAGLVRPERGEVRLASRPAPTSVQERAAVAGLVPQDPALALYHDTVAAEVGRPLARGQGSSEATAGILTRWGLDGLAERHPRDLSVGQQQRVAVASMLAHEPPAWMLDEPTRGADHTAKEWLGARLRAHAAAGGAAIVATHDTEGAAAFATRVVGLEAGHVAFDLPARQAFGVDGPLPTQVARLVPGAIRVEEVVRA